MFAQYIVSSKVAEWSRSTLSFIGKDAVKFYPHHAGRSGQNGSDAIRSEQRADYIQN